LCQIAKFKKFKYKSTITMWSLTNQLHRWVYDGVLDQGRSRWDRGFNSWKIKERQYISCILHFKSSYHVWSSSEPNRL